MIRNLDKNVYKESVLMLSYRVMTTMQPKILWAQTPELIFLTIEVPGTEEASVDTFEDLEKGSSLLCVDEDTKEVHLRMDLFRSIDETKNEIKSTPRNIQVRLVKKEEDTWERLLFDKNSYGNLAVDWEKWAAEEDDDEDLQEMMPGDFDMSSLANMGGMADALPGLDDENDEIEDDDGNYGDDDTEGNTEADDAE